jgi:hypothetical protein
LPLRRILRLRSVEIASNRNLPSPVCCPQAAEAPFIAPRARGPHDPSFAAGMNRSARHHGGWAVVRLGKVYPLPCWRVHVLPPRRSRPLLGGGLPTFLHGDGLDWPGLGPSRAQFCYIHRQG